MKSKGYLGISAFFHDSAAAIVVDGLVVAAISEERFSRVKGDSSFPFRAIKFCLQKANLKLQDVEIIFYEDPQIKSEREIQSSMDFKSYKDFSKHIKTLFRDGFFHLEEEITRSIESISHSYGEIFDTSKLYFSKHHLSHLSSAFTLSPFSESGFLIIDGVGELSTTSIGHAQRNFVSSKSEYVTKKEIHYPHSLGLLYASITKFLGFKVNSGEYKVMGLAPYGDPIYAQLIRENLIELYKDGSFLLNLDYFTFHKSSEEMFNKEISKLFEFDPREDGSELSKNHFDLASSLQNVLNLAVINLAKEVKNLSRSSNLVMAGGVALNCVSNAEILKTNLFESIWIVPAAGDSGGALGAALLGYENLTNKGIKSLSLSSFTPYLGAEYQEHEIELALNSKHCKFSKLNSINEVIEYTAERLLSNQVVGWFQGRSEFGPRALGNRSILANPQGTRQRDFINQKVKFRESFRPFAPVILEEYSSIWLDLSHISEKSTNNSSPFMLFTANIKPEISIEKIQSCVHIDGTARYQTVSPKSNELFYQLVNRFFELSGVPMLINTSFNVRGEPIIETPDDALNCFFGSDLDILIIGNYIILKDENLSLVSHEYPRSFPPD